MKLEKFYAESISQALVIIQKKLGPDAIIYSQVKSDNFVEVVAGMPKSEPQLTPVKIANEEKKSVSTSMDNRMLHIRKLNNAKINHELEQMEKLNLLQYRLRQLNFSHKFIDNFAEKFSQCDLEDIVNENQIVKLLLSKIKIEAEEFIDEKKICALIGPTGVGKSTTIAKLAKRFVSRYGNEALGIISTDFQRIISKNQFYYLGKLLTVQVEYARDLMELQEAIHRLESKKLILIDTAGVNQNDNKKVAELFETISGDGLEISLYLVLPCNVQTEILEDVVVNFKMENTAGCIITKKDECKSLAPCLSVVLNHDLPIAYICNGQNISKNIQIADKISLITDIFELN